MRIVLRLPYRESKVRARHIMLRNYETNHRNLLGVVRRGQGLKVFFYSMVDMLYGLPITKLGLRDKGFLEIEGGG